MGLKSEIVELQSENVELKSEIKVLHATVGELKQKSEDHEEELFFCQKVELRGRVVPY